MVTIFTVSNEMILNIPCNFVILGLSDDKFMPRKLSAISASHLTSTSAFRSVSVSGLQISKDARKMVVNYQGDQIYTFDTRDREQQSGATGILGGHINYSTFLKGVAFFGSCDE